MGIRHEFRVSIEPAGLGRCEQAGFVASPHEPDPAGPVVVCVPGGTYTAAGYYDLEVPGRSGYSMAASLVAAGITVVGLDHLGVGASSRPSPADAVDARACAAADHLAVGEIEARLRAGTLAPGLTPALGPLLGVGHSMGSGLTMVQQAEHRTYAAVALLGMSASAGYRSGDGGDDPAERRAAATAAIRASATDESWDDGYYRARPESGHGLFHLGDVPRDVVARDRALATTVPRAVAIDVATPGFLAPFAAAIETPVFLGFGEVDLSPDPWAEPGGFRGSRDVTLFVLAGSAHCHNTSGTRQLLWNRLATWAASVTAG